MTGSRRAKRAWRIVYPHGMRFAATWPLWLAALLSFTGCARLSRRGPVGQDVIIARQLSQQGMDALHHGSLGQAENRFEQAIAHCPSNSTARYQLANCLWQRGARNEAIKQLEIATEMTGGDDVEMMVELGYMRANVGELEKARQIAERAIRSDSQHVGAWQLRGDVLREQQEWEEALASYHRALTHDPDNATIQLAVAEVYFRLERPARLLATLHRLDDLIPADRQPERMLVLKSLAFQKLERHDEAVAVLLRAAQERRLSHIAAVQLAKAQLTAGQYGEAQHTVNQQLTGADVQQQSELRQLTADINDQRIRDGGTVQR